MWRRRGLCSNFNFLLATNASRFGPAQRQELVANEPPFQLMRLRALPRLHPLHIKKAFYHSPSSFPRLSHINEMDDAPRTGQTRVKPDSGSSSPPIGKKPRLETPLDSRITEKSIASILPKTSYKKEARKARRKGLHVLPEPFSTEDVLWRDVASVLGQVIVDQAVDESAEWESPFALKEEVELTVQSLSSNGACFCCLTCSVSDP
jgi:hypothetical protein